MAYERPRVTEKLIPIVKESVYAGKDIWKVWLVPSTGRSKDLCEETKLIKEWLGVRSFFIQGSWHASEKIKVVSKKATICCAHFSYMYRLISNKYEYTVTERHAPKRNPLLNSTLHTNGTRSYSYFSAHSSAHYRIIQVQTVRILGFPRRRPRVTRSDSDQAKYSYS